MTKQYTRKEPEFVQTLLVPRPRAIHERLLSQNQRAVAKRAEQRDVKQLLNLIEKEKLLDLKEEEVLKRVRSLLREENSNSQFTGFPAGYNFLAHAIGAQEKRYTPWLTMIGTLPLTPGVSCIFGDTLAGKTTMADLLACNIIDNQGTDKVLRVKMGESGSDLETFISFDELIEDLPAELPPVLIIDSLRLSLFDLEGAARSMSISNRVFRFLTEIDIFAQGHGIAVVCVMNPLSGDDTKIKEFLKDVESSIACIIDLKTWNCGQFRHRHPKFGRKTIEFTIPGEIIFGEPQEVTNVIEGPGPTSTSIKGERMTTRGYISPLGRSRVKSPL